MRCLVDTNVWLERLLDQERSAQVGRFLEAVPTELLFITDFSLHSIGLVLVRLGETELLLDFIQDTFSHGDVHLIRPWPADFWGIVSATISFHLDFDDAYQYTAASKFGLTLVSFDWDFDRTALGRKTPEQALKEIG